MAQPAVRFEIASVQAEPAHGRWRVVFRVYNEAPLPLVLLDAWVPHGRFRGAGHVPLSVSLGPGEWADVAVVATALEAPGTEIENAFLILRVSEWRVFVRMRVVFDDDAVPHPVIESVTRMNVKAGDGALS